jgi:hypothetical protein
MALQVQTVLLVLLVPKATLEILVLKAVTVHPVLMVNLDLREILVMQAIPVLLVPQVQTV